MIGEMTDEVMSWEVNQQTNLMNAIFSQIVNHQAQQLQKEKCCGCKVDHPSQRRQDCIMMTKEEGWINYGLEAVEHILERGILWKQYREAIRVMKLVPHKQKLQHFQKFASQHEIMLNLLMDLQFKADLSEYQDILGYLHYWKGEHLTFFCINIKFNQKPY